MRKLNAMPNSRRLARSPLPWWRLLLLLAHYFIGYLFLYPKLLAKITLAIDPNAYYVPDSYLFLTYVWMILSTLLIAFPIWRQSHLHYRKERPDLLFSNLCYMGAMFVVSLVIGLIVTHFSGLSDSANEQVVLAELERSPLLSFFTILIYSPIVEESVFRGGIYRTLRGYMGVVSAMLLTALHSVCCTFMILSLSVTGMMGGICFFMAASVVCFVTPMKRIRPFTAACFCIL